MQGGASDFAILRKAISARLGIVGTPDVVTNDACRALLAHAQTPGGEQRLRMLLATLFFLVETEHAPRIDLALVQRATELQPAAATSVSAGPQRIRAHTVLALALAACFVAVAAGYSDFYIMHPQIAPRATGTAPDQPWREPSPKPLLLARTAIPIAPAPPALPVRPAAMQSHAVAPKAVEPTTAAPTSTRIALAPPVAETAKPPAAPQWQPGDWQPRSPAPTLLLRFSMLSAATPPHARFIAQQLEQAGFKVDAVPDFARARYRMPSLRFFYEQDRGLALRVAGAVHAIFDPKLVAARHGSPPPGTIELYLP